MFPSNTLITLSLGIEENLFAVQTKKFSVHRQCSCLCAAVVVFGPWHAGAHELLLKVAPAAMTTQPPEVSPTGTEQ